jgi:hypothetical protein
MYVGGNRNPVETYAVKSRPLYHMRNAFDSEVTGADVNFEHQSYHCATDGPLLEYGL